jgi:hypothetical protein
VARPSSTSLFVEHRTASGWQRVPSPVLGLAPSESVGDVQVAAISGPTGAWAFADVAVFPALTAQRVVAVQWTGSAWSAPQSLPDASSGPVLARSAKDIWKFGAFNASRTAPAVCHYNGTSWSRYHVPWNVDTVSGNGAAGVWITGRGTAGARVSVAHWSNGGWRQVPLPANLPKGSATFADGIVASGAKDVWASLEYRPHFGPTFFGYLLHWNGGQWSRVSLPFTTVKPRQLATDGHGGLWLSPDPRYLYHYSGGHWSPLLKLPTKAGFTPTLNQLVAIPGTTSLLAAGGLLPSPGTVDGAVFTYGP